MTARVLIVEDDTSLGRTLQERLAREGHDAAWAASIAEARVQLDRQAWDLVIVDVKLGDGSGFGLAREMRKRLDVPIMFMTALNTAESRLEGFEIGAEEYLPKPFHLREFTLRVRHVLASRQAMPRQVSCDDALIDFDALTVTVGGRTRHLQVRDARVLRLLVERAPNVVSRSELLDRAWGEDRFPTPRAVDNAIVRLRAALGERGGTRIRSIRGTGYQWTQE